MPALTRFAHHLYRIKAFAVRSFAYPGRLDETLREHSEILESVKAGNTEAAYSAVLKHMEGPVKIIAKLM